MALNKSTYTDLAHEPPASASDSGCRTLVDVPGSYGHLSLVCFAERNASLERVTTSTAQAQLHGLGVVGYWLRLLVVEMVPFHCVAWRRASTP